MQALVIIPILLFTGCSTLRGPEPVNPAKVCAPNYVAAFSYDDVKGDISRHRGQVVCGK